jgi:chaperonin GroES
VKQQLKPLFDQVVIKELEPDRVRRSGLLLPPGEHQTPPQHGIVLAVGPGLDWWGGAGIKMPVAPGDHVVFPGSAGVWVDVEEERLLVCRVGQLLGVLDEVDEPGEPRLGSGAPFPALRSSSARTNSSRSPSRTPWMLPASTFVRWSFTIVYGWST